MNCKENQLVRYVGSDQTRTAPNCYGWMGTTVRSFNRGIGVEWEVTPPIPTRDGRTWRFVFDRSLRPVNNPGDDAVDEMVRLVGPAPKVERKVTA